MAGDRRRGSDNAGLGWGAATPSPGAAVRPLPSRCSPLLALLVVACGGDGEPGESAPIDDEATELPPEWCDGATSHQWDTVSAEDVDLFPDGLMEVADPASPTGVRLSVESSRAPWVDHAPPLLADAVNSLEDLSGFGTLGGVLLRFDAPVTDLPADADASLSSDAWMLVDLDDPDLARVPFEALVIDDGLSVMLWPLRPMRTGARHALVVTTAATAADGGCIAPAEATRALLYGTPDDAILDEAAPRYQAAIADLGLRADDVSALSVFTTHADIDVVREVAEAEAEVPVAWTSDADCHPRGDLLECELTLTVRDRRDEDGLVDPDLQPVEAEIPVTIWLPDLDGPYPVVVYGHGLGSSRSEGYRVASEMGETPYALVAMEAVEHGDHPSAAGTDRGDDALRFLGIDLNTVSIRPRVIRGNFDQTTLDRLRLIRLLREQPDLDGDGDAELMVDRVGYLGISLGAILGPQLLALDGEIDGAVWSVGGARLMSIVTDSTALTDYEDLIIALVGSRERFDRLTAVAQHVVDPVDPGVWATHVLRDRFDDAPAPSVLVQVGMADEVVPPSSGHALARALDLPHLEPVVETVPLLEVIDEEPVVANLEDGATGAFFQFDRVTRDGTTGPARHVATPTSVEGVLQIQTFLDTWIRDGEPQIIDPYRVLAE